jgi:hypothetical protein
MLVAHSQHGIRALGLAPARCNSVRFLAAEDHLGAAVSLHRSLLEIHFILGQIAAAPAAAS